MQRSTSQPDEVVTAPAGHAAMHGRSTHDGQGSNPAAGRGAIRRTVDEQGAAQRDPGAELRMDEHPEETPAPESRGLGEMHEREWRLDAVERQAQRGADAGARDERQHLLLHDRTRELVEGMRMRRERGMRARRDGDRRSRRRHRRCRAR